MRVVARVDAAALVHNLTLARERAPDSRVFAVVKADAYGHGLVEAAAAFSAADGLAVACVEEAVELREAGVDAPVLVLEGVGDREELRAARTHGLDVVVHADWQLDLLKRDSLRGLGRFWVKFDTGMHRLGFALSQARAVAASLAELGRQRPGVMSHLACADEPERPETGRQLAAFDRVRVQFGGPASLANSAGVLAHPDTHFDWVRPGLMLYGVSPFPGRNGSDLGLRPAMTLTARVLSVQSAAVGDGVGYGFDWRAGRPSRIAIVSIGYGDGYPWRAAGSAVALVRGRRAPLAGRVSMDMLALDVTDVSGVEPGDPVTLWGDGLPVEEVAAAAGTSPYEIVCSVTRRVPRRHTADKEGL